MKIIDTIESIVEVVIMLIFMFVVVTGLVWVINICIDYWKSLF